MSKNWPALVIAVVVSIYWLRVVTMVRKSRKKSGHGANLVPPEPTGRVIRIVWIPIVLCWVFLPFVAFAASKPERFPSSLQRMFGTTRLPMAIGWIAAIVAVGCLRATFICWERMGKSWRMGIDPNDRTQLIFSGPYAFVRHPIYGLSSLLMLATLAAVPNFLMLCTCVIHLSLLQWEALREERHLIEVHGDEYRMYSRHTGRFFPRSFHAYCQSS